MFGSLSLVSLFLLLSVAAAQSIWGHIEADDSLSMLADVVGSAGYETLLSTLDTAGTLTLFAPSDEAFATSELDPDDVAFFTQILNYHLLGSVVHSADLDAVQFPESELVDHVYVTLGGEGQRLVVLKDLDTNVVTLYFQQFTVLVTTADITCSNGVIHIIDQILEFPTLSTAEARNANLRLFVNYAAFGNILPLVNTHSQVVIFAPTDAAIEAAEIEDLTREEVATLLGNHVVLKNLYSTDLSDGLVLETSTGQALSVSKIEGPAGDEIRINGNLISLPNILTQSGVVHAVDAVIFPAGFRARVLQRRAKAAMNATNTL